MEYVPAAKVAEYLEEALAKFQGVSLEEYRAQARQLGYWPGSKELAHKAGISLRGLGRILRADPPHLKTEKADRVLVAAGVSPLALAQLLQSCQSNYEGWEIGYAADVIHLPSRGELEVRINSGECTGCWSS